MRYFVFACIIFLTKTSNAQIYSFSHFSKANGLSSDFIYDIQQDEKGFLILATGDGFCTYNGSKFITYDTTSGLADNIVSCLSSSNNGEIVLGHVKNGLSKHSGTKFQNIEGTGKMEVPVKSVFNMGDLLLFGTNTGSLGVIEKNVTTFIALPGATFINKIIQVNGITLVATDNGIYKFNGDRSLNLVKSTEGIHFTSLSTYLNTHLLAGTDNGELSLYKVNRTSEILQHVATSMVSDNVPIKSVIHTKTNQLIIASWGKGIYLAEIDKVSSKLINNINIASKNGLGGLYVNTLFIDFNENVWIGTFGNGVYKLDNTHFKIFNQQSGLHLDRVSAVLAIRENVYIGLERGLQVLNTKRTDSIVIFNSKNRFKDIRVTALAKINEFDLLIGTENNGLYLFDTKTQTFVNYFRKFGLNNSPQNINHVCISTNSVAYISTLDGLFIHDLKTNTLKILTTDEGLPHNNIQNTFLDSEYRLWFVAPKSVPGLIQNDSIVLFKDIPDFAFYNATSICEGQKGTIYITTKGDGIYKYSKGVFTQYTSKNGLLNNYVLSAVFDTRKEQLICTHSGGFSVLDLRKNKIRAVMNKTNLNAFESTVNSISIETGNVYFGTEEGLGVYSIDEEKTKCQAPKISILRLIINKKAYDVTDSVINLPYSNYDLLFEYIGIELTFPDEVVYTYKLDGYDKEFKNTKDKQLEYIKLSEGQYKLVLFSTNYLGVRNAKPLSVTINIDKPIYKKWWFIFSLFLAFIAVVYFAVRIKTAQLRKQRIVLEKKVEERTVEIVRINKILEAKNQDIMSGIDYALRIQNVLLPKKEQINETLDAFIFHQAKDVVSGDFYWFYTTEKYIYIAAVDCTGHGVSGAFMSIIGTFFLDQILAESHDPTPSYIVKELDSRLVDSLHQKNESDGVADGMDAAICRIDRLHEEVIFCGARRPLYYIRKGELTEIKSNRFSAGGFIMDSNREFNDEVISFQKGDMFYLFSDGYADQFGGTSNRRYYTKQFKDLLIKVSKLGTQEQLQEINKDFFKWKGSTEQNDDVLLVGIRL